MSSTKNITQFGRFKGAGWFPIISKSRAFIGGAGGIGSHLAFYLARTGCNVVVVDMDTVGAENLAGQLYGPNQIGKKKVDALGEVIGSLCEHYMYTGLDTEITDKPDQWRSIVSSSDIVCVGFDNLEARKEVYEQWKKNGKGTSIFVDGRLAFEEGDIFILHKKSPEDDLKAYEATYFSPEEHEELPCTLKATTHCGSFIAALMTSQIINFCYNATSPMINRDQKSLSFHLPIFLIRRDNLKLEDDGQSRPINTTVIQTADILETH